MHSWSLQRLGRAAALALAALLLAAGMFLLPGVWARLSAALLGFACLLVVMWVFSGQERSYPWQLTHPLHSIRHLTIDGNLFIAPPSVTAVYLPFDEAPQPKLRSGAILWASAATVTHSLAATDDQRAILSALLPLGFAPETFLTRCPVLRDVTVHGQHGCIVKDGNGLRAYFQGDPAQLLKACTYVWEQQERPVTEDDHARLPASQPGLYGLAMAPVDGYTVGPLTYLGALQVATALQHTEQVKLLTDMGYQVTVEPSRYYPQHTAALQALSTTQDVPQRTLHVTQLPEGPDSYIVNDPAADWASSIVTHRLQSAAQHRQAYEAFIACLTLALAGVLWELPAWLLPLGMLLTIPRGLNDVKYILGRKPSAPPKPSGVHLCAGLVWCLFLGIILKIFAAYVVPAAYTTGLIIAFCALAMLMSLEERGLPLRLALPVGVIATTAAWLILQPPVLLGCFCLLAGLLAALILRLILRQKDYS